MNDSDLDKPATFTMRDRFTLHDTKQKVDRLHNLVIKGGTAIAGVMLAKFIGLFDLVISQAQSAVSIMRYFW